MQGFFFMAKTTRTPRAKKHVAECVAKGTCLYEGCTEPMHTSGRCQKHYRSFYNKQLQMTTEQKAEFISTLQREGTLLKPQEIRDLKRNDSDAVAAREAK